MYHSPPAPPPAPPPAAPQRAKVSKHLSTRVTDEKLLQELCPLLEGAGREELDALAYDPGTGLPVAAAKGHPVGAPPAAASAAAPCEFPGREQCLIKLNAALCHIRGARKLWEEVTDTCHASVSKWCSALFVELHSAISTEQSIDNVVLEMMAGIQCDYGEVTITVAAYAKQILDAAGDAKKKALMGLWKYLKAAILDRFKKENA